MIEIDRVLHEQIRSYGAKAYRKFLCSEVIKNWSRLVDESIAAQVKPVAIEHGVLFVHVENSAYKDQMKFFSEEIIEAINESFGQEAPLVKEIQIAKGFQVADMPPDKNPPAQVDKPVKPEDITLTDEEIKRCEEQVKKFSNADLRLTVLNTLLSQAKAQKFRLANGWHKCDKCDTLCPPEEIFCEVCRVKEREAMKRKLSDILYDAPWLKTQEAQKLLLDQMPHMRGECTADSIASVRTSLIQNLASRIRFGDESPDVLKLVMLRKRLPPDKLTPAIIRRALSELQFNPADSSRFAQKFGDKNFPN